MPFELTPNVSVQRDAEGSIRQLQHLHQPYRVANAPALLSARAAFAAPLRPRDLAELYVRDVLPHYELEAEVALALDSLTANTPTEDGAQLRFASEKSVAGNATVSYVQTYHGVPVWRAGLAVRLEEEPMQVIGSQSTMLRDVSVETPPASAPYLPDLLTAEKVAQILGIHEPGNPLPRLNQARLFVFRYQASQRTPPPPVNPQDPAQGFNHPPLSLPLPQVAAGIEDNNDYFVSEVYFTWARAGEEAINWIALVEVDSGSVLYLRPLVGCLATGLVFQVDPVTQSGNTAADPGASETSLNTFRLQINLNGLTPPASGQNQELRGSFVRLLNVSPPAIAPPQVTPPGQFHFSAVSDDFSAVNAYYHCDRLFRLLADLGLNVSSYLDGTQFPVRVDHRASFSGQTNIVNASAPGNALGRGSDGFRFALARTSSTVGLANDWRVVLHEFGHAVLWDHVHSPNFGFAHSAGDSLAAILNDPGNRAERMLTFPWVASIINRRHDRTPSSGWAWYGPRYAPFDSFGPDPSGYLAEQMLSSTMFRIYQAAGGDAADINQQQFAAHYVAFLVLKAISLLSPTTNANSPEDFAEVLIQADTGTFVYQNQTHFCGALPKVIRWSFEQQGAYQPPGTPLPVTSPGAPPEVDVYIDDGRGGNYEFQPNVAQTQDIWVRQSADGGLAHQTPLRNAVNSVYVRVKNRGTQPAPAVRVRAFRSSAAEPVWPTDWDALTPMNLTLPAPLASAEAVVGPFAWTPDSSQETLLAIVEADGDPSNVSRFSATRPISNARLVPLDNNMAQRSVNIN